MQDRLVWMEGPRNSDLPPELAAREWKLDAVYARLEGARDRITRLEEENARLREQNALLGG